MNAIAEILSQCAACKFTRVTYFQQCPQCREWNSCMGIVGGRLAMGKLAPPNAVSLETLDGVRFYRSQSGIPQLDQALGGGFVLGTSTIFYGPPNCGKTTLALQAAFWLAARLGRNALYLSNEQSGLEICMAAKRLELGLGRIWFANPADFQTVRGHISRNGLPAVVVVDSLQQFYDSGVSQHGRNPQFDAYIRLRNVLQQYGVPGIFVSQVNAAGTIRGGPRYAHEANAVIHFKQKQGSDVRELYVEKNRCGKAQFSVTMTMTAKGLV